jgi:hypothetical protein
MQSGFDGASSSRVLIGGGAAVRPRAARAQLAGMPVIGFLDSRWPDAMVSRLRAFRQGLKETATLRARTLRLYTAGPRIKLIDFRKWRVISLSGRSP